MTRTRTWLAAALMAVALPAAHAAESSTLTVGVQDQTSAVVVGATVTVATAHRLAVDAGRTDARGQAAFDGLARGSYLVTVDHAGFAPRHLPVTVDGRAPASLDVVLTPAALEEEVTVTASPGLVQGLDSSASPVNVVGQAEIAARAKSVVAQAATEEVGVHLQRTSPTIAGVYVRGLTGNKVSVFIDGVRYSTASARGGINTFLDLVDASSLESLEVLRGPMSAQYGSDALGGSLQFATRTPAAITGGRRAAGGFSTFFGSADQGYGASLRGAWQGSDLGVQANLSGQKANTLRPGEGIDSHNAVTRFFDLPSSVAIGSRLPDTGFTQYGGSAKAVWSPSSASHLILSYTRSAQDDGKRYDQLLGGDGNLIADLEDLRSDFAYARYDRRISGFFDHLTLTASFNRQREERINQGGNGNPRASITHEPERTTVGGGQVLVVREAGKHGFTMGADYYGEGIDAPSYSESPVDGSTAIRRGRVPDGATYSSFGAYVQDVFRASSSVTLLGSLRFSRFAYEAQAADSPLVNGQPLWPDDSLDLSDAAFRAGVVWSATEHLTLVANLSRGFRAPHITDLGTLGLTGAGFEVAAPDIAGLGATLGSTADATAVDTGLPVEQLGAETSLAGEGSLRWHTARFDTDLTVFVNDVLQNITRQTLILPPGAEGTPLGDEVVTTQLPSGAVFVPASSNPVLARANFDDARLWGFEHTLRVELGAAVSASTVLTYLHSEDKRTGLPPNLEGGRPAPDGWLRVRWEPSGQRFWVEPYLHAALANDQLSSLDLTDRRTGAPRSRSSIASFFTNGARARGMVGPGADQAAGTPDDVLLATGETLPQIQLRVLGPTGASAPLFTELAGYAVFGVRGAVRFGRHEILADLENIGDRNYRGVSWGVDAPGRSLYLRYSARF